MMCITRRNSFISISLMYIYVSLGVFLYIGISIRQQFAYIILDVFLRKSYIQVLVPLSTYQPTYILNTFCINTLLNLKLFLCVHKTIFKCYYTQCGLVVVARYVTYCIPLNTREVDCLAIYVYERKITARAAAC